MTKRMGNHRKKQKIDMNKNKAICKEQLWLIFLISSSILTNRK